MSTLSVKKTLNNNVLIAEHESYGEVVLIGKGIGFNRKKGDPIQNDIAEKMFVLKGEKEQEQYKNLLPFLDENMSNVTISAIELIRERTNSFLNEHIHIALTDHILFAINRLMRGMEIRNPFLVETRTLYPFEYEIAREVVEMINDMTDVNLPEGEVGFIALHIHSAMMNKDLSEVNQHSQLISRLTTMIEQQLDVKINKESVDYMRLVRHIRYTIERVLREERVEEPEKIAKLLKEEYPLCYNLSWKLIKMMQQTLRKPVYDAEAVYLTMHLQRIQTKVK
ncbi:transcriptional antiterminator [[Bacillus] enclensis]|uniref:Transcriptional antiterminator, BglG family n=2 Tax=Rossellomorea TaxID=2837508 RepID=A0A0V8H545_9BACI|nr:transcription antiterminator [[Bacillus] enclensis]OAT83520.1 transcriptional antiterminator [Bacillus sp. MKU004]QTC41034.1 transcription antiterminator [Bacillus sp. V3]QWC23124.1 transcription antiterminator [Bacillus haikouensis]KSU57633.1 transcriptional antiterminator [[Bacillus] enclensis]MBH9968461.1 transcription antiterminator [[Bacillus] enclensis]